MFPRFVNSMLKRRLLIVNDMSITVKTCLFRHHWLTSKRVSIPDLLTLSFTISEKQV